MGGNPTTTPTTSETDDEVGCVGRKDGERTEEKEGGGVLVKETRRKGCGSRTDSRRSPPAASSITSIVVKQ